MPSTVAHDYPSFEVRAPWWGADLQTLRNVVRGPVVRPLAGVESRRLELPMADGSGDRLAALLERPAVPRPGACTVVLIHGLGGDETSHYVRASSAHLLARGHAVLRLNLRGAGPSRPLCRQQYHAGRSEDLRDAFAGLPADAVGNGGVAVGYSLGGNVLLKFLAEHATGFPWLRGAVSISAPIDLARAAERILEPRNWFYHRHLLTGMKREALADPGIGEEERRIVGQVRTIVEFDDHLVAPRNGFASAQDYYRRTHARQFLPEVSVDTLVVHALDDPWIPRDMYTDFPWSRNPRLQPLLPESGGHVGFHASDSRTPWHDRCIAAFLGRLEGGRVVSGAGAPARVPSREGSAQLALSQG